MAQLVYLTLHPPEPKGGARHATAWEEEACPFTCKGKEGEGGLGGAGRAKLWNREEQADNLADNLACSATPFQVATLCCSSQTPQYYSK